MPKRVFLLSIDDLRFDALSCTEETRYLDRYGLAGMRRTPTLDGIAARGVRFRQAVSTASYTPTSHASMLTGTYPPRHGVRAFMRNGLTPSVPTLAETLQLYGFHTVSAIDFGPMFTLLELDRGFEERLVADDAALFEHLDSHREEGLFCFVHFVDVHPPVSESYCQPEEGYNNDFYDGLERLAAELGLDMPPLRPDGVADESSRAAAVALSSRIRAYAEDRRMADAIELPRYLAGVNKFDGGRLRYFLGRLEELGLLEGSLLVITADHGQGAIPDWKMGDPSIPLKFDHGEVVLEETIRVPLIIAGTELPEGEAVDSQVSLVDIAPTILDWAGVDVPEEVQGRSLLGPEDGEESLGYAEVWFHDRAELSRHLKRSLASGSDSGGYETFLNQRVIRTPHFKYSRRGTQLDDADWAASNEAFIDALFTKLLARVPDPEAARELARQLRAGTVTREQLAADFETRNPGREALFDLDRDPREEVNLLVLAKSLRTLDIPHDAPAIAAEMAAAMDALEEEGTRELQPVQAVPSEGLQKVEARLRDLGYIE